MQVDTMHQIGSVENHKSATKKPLGLIKAFSKVTENKINTQKSLVFLYTNNEKSKR